MGRATTQAREASIRALNAATGVDLSVARDLFTAAEALGGAPQLVSALADAAAAPAARSKVVSDVFGGLHATAVALLQTVTAERWSSTADLVSGVEELAVRAVAVAQPDADVESELFELNRLVAANHDLELALGSRLGDRSAKGGLIRSLLTGRASDATTTIVASLVQQPGDRRVRALLSWAQRIVAAQRNQTVAIVYVASPLTAEQAARLAQSLTARAGTPVAMNTVVDPTVVGGVRVEIGDEVIDATVSSRLSELRQRLAG